MSARLSKMYNMDVFSDSGKYLGNAQDFIVDFESGEIARILMETLPRDKEAARATINDKSVRYDSVKSVEDVIVVTKPSYQ